ncbi:Far1 [Hordeum vulgare]|nr:Far1 [Hordeum vulgare]
MAVSKKKGPKEPQVLPQGEFAVTRKQNPYFVPQDDALARRPFWNKTESLIYSKIIKTRTNLFVDVKSIDMGHMWGLGPIVGFNKDFDTELVAQFYATIHFHDGSPPLMVNGTILTLEHVMQRLDAIENKIATVELIEGLDRKIHNQITQYGSKVGNFLKNLKDKELIVNDSSRIGKLEDVITNLGSAFAAVQNTPNLTIKKTVKPVFVPRASGESSNKDENLNMINDHATYGLSTKDDYM